MTRTQHALAQRWRSLAVAAVLFILSGAVVLVWLRIDAEARRADALAAEAALRGDAVATLAADVRALREQIKAAGRAPARPDPTHAVDNLPARVEVPVPVPGPTGPRGPRGETGSPDPAGVSARSCPSGQTRPDERGTEGPVCRRDGAPHPGPSPASRLLGLPVERRRIA